MRNSNNFHADDDDTAKVAVGGSYRAIDICNRNTPGSLSLYFPEGVPLEKLQTICDAINDALDTVRAEQSEAA